MAVVMGVKKPSTFRHNAIGLSSLAGDEYTIKILSDIILMLSDNKFILLELATMAGCAHGIVETGVRFQQGSPRC